MARVLHGSARTTPKVRAELQASQASARIFASQYGLNPKTVLKWRMRTATADAPVGLEARSTVLTEAQEAIVVEFRRRTLLPLDDRLGCLHDGIPNRTRDALNRCCQHHDMSRLPGRRRPVPSAKRFNDGCELRSAEDRLHRFLAIDWKAKFAHAEFHATAEMATSAAFMRSVVQAFPYQIRGVLSANGVAFISNASAGWYTLRHPRDRVGDACGLEHRLTKAYRPLDHRSG